MRAKERLASAPDPSRSYLDSDDESLNLSDESPVERYPPWQMPEHTERLTWSIYPRFVHDARSYLARIGYNIVKRARPRELHSETPAHPPPPPSQPGRSQGSESMSEIETAPDAPDSTPSPSDIPSVKSSGSDSESNSSASTSPSTPQNPLRERPREFPMSKACNNDSLESFMNWPATVRNKDTSRNAMINSISDWCDETSEQEIESLNDPSASSEPRPQELQKLISSFRKLAISLRKMPHGKRKDADQAAACIDLVDQTTKQDSKLSFKLKKELVYELWSQMHFWDQIFVDGESVESAHDQLELIQTSVGSCENEARPRRHRFPEVVEVSVCREKNRLAYRRPKPRKKLHLRKLIRRLLRQLTLKLAEKAWKRRTNKGCASQISDNHRSAESSAQNTVAIRRDGTESHVQT